MQNMFKVFIAIVFILTILTNYADPAKLCCSDTVKIPGFTQQTSSGYENHISSGKIYLLDNRRALITNFEYHKPSPFGFWSARLSSAGDSNQLDMLGDYRSNILLTATGSEKCQRVPKQDTQNITVILPMGRKWADIAWFGIYDYGYKYVLNYVWVNPPHFGNLAKFSICLNQPACWTRADDPKGCHKKLLPCKDNNVECADSVDNYCYILCEELKLDRNDPVQEVRSCGITRRNENPVKLFGCRGVVNATKADGGCPAVL